MAKRLNIEYIGKKTMGLQYRDFMITSCVTIFIMFVTVNFEINYLMIIPLLLFIYFKQKDRIHPPHKTGNGYLYKIENIEDNASFEEINTSLSDLIIELKKLITEIEFKKQLGIYIITNCNSKHRNVFFNLSKSQKKQPNLITVRNQVSDVIFGLAHNDKQVMYIGYTPECFDDYKKVVNHLREEPKEAINKLRIEDNQ